MNTKQNITRWLGLALACGTLIFTGSAQAGKPVKPPPEPPPPSGPVYQITSLGSFGAGSVATAINESGTVVGQVYTGLPYYMAFKVVPEPSANGPVYYRDTAPADGVNALMVPLPGFDPTLSSYAYDINDAGMIVGNGYHSIWYGTDVLATFWLGTSPTSLGLLAGYDGEGYYYEGEYCSIAYSVNNQGVIAVGTQGSPEGPAGVVVPKDSNNDGMPDTWYEDANGDGFNDLFLPVSPCLRDSDGRIVTRFWPRGINDAGQVAGTSQLITPDAQDSDGDGNPWFADEDGDGLNDLMVPLIGLDGSSSFATDINAAGQVVGGSNGRAVRWDFTGGTQTVTDLGLLSNSVKGMVAEAINDKGQIVGLAIFQKSNTTFLFDGGKMYDLAECLTNGSGWANLYAEDINNEGCIVGYGELNGLRQAFVAVPVTQP